jgi:hypothetical protein
MYIHCGGLERQLGVILEPATRFSWSINGTLRRPLIR